MDIISKRDDDCTSENVPEQDDESSVQSTPSLTSLDKDEFLLQIFSDANSTKSFFENISGGLMPSVQTAKQQCLSVSPVSFLPLPNTSELLAYPPLTGLFANRVDVALTHLKEVNLLDSLKVDVDPEKMTQPDKEDS